MTMTEVSQKTLSPKDADEFRDLLPSSGVFEMLDCEVEIYCPEVATTEELQRMVTTLESMINLVDVRISATPETLQNGSYKIIITQVPIERIKGLAPKRD